MYVRARVLDPRSIRGSLVYRTITVRTTSACMSKAQLVQQDHARYGTCCTRLCPEI